MSQVCAETQTEVFEIEVMPDHVHLLVECHPHQSLDPIDQGEIIQSVAFRVSALVQPSNIRTMLSQLTKFRT